MPCGPCWGVNYYRETKHDPRPWSPECVCLCVLGSGWFDLGLAGWEGFPEVGEERIQVSAWVRATSCGPGGLLLSPWALLVMIPMEMTVGCRLPAKEAESWGRRSWVHTPALPLKLYVLLLIFHLSEPQFLQI